jgi:hypothetical protein
LEIFQILEELSVGRFIGNWVEQTVFIVLVATSNYIYTRDVNGARNILLMNIGFIPDLH